MPIETQKNNFDQKLRKAFNLDRVFRLVLILIPLGVIGNVIFSYTTSDLNAFGRLADFSLPLFLLAAGFAFFPWITTTIRLWVWVRFANVECKWRDLWKITLAQELVAAITPSAVGGAPVKAALFVKLGASPGKALSLMSLGSLEEFSFLVILFPLIMTFFGLWDLPVFNQVFQFAFESYWLVPLLVSIPVILISLLCWRRSRNRFKKYPFYRKLTALLSKAFSDFMSVSRFVIKKGKARFLVTVLLTTIGWFSRLFVIGALVESMGFEVDYMLFATLQWIIFNASILLPTPGGAVGAEALFFMLFKSYLSPDGIGVITLGWRFMTFYLVNIVAALLFLGLIFGRGRARVVNANCRPILRRGRRRDGRRGCSSTHE